LVLLAVLAWATVTIIDALQVAAFAGE